MIRPSLAWLAPALALAACGPADAPPLDYGLAGTVEGLPAGDGLALAVGESPAQEVTADGPFAFTRVLADGATYELRVARQPAGAYCVVKHGIGAVRAADVAGVRVACDTDPSTPLFDTGRLQRMRLTVSVDDWNAFVLNSGRSAYRTNARGDASWTLWSVSEVYRRGTLEYLGDDGATLATVPDVGFRMRGNTSRLWPEAWTQDPLTGDWAGAPRRFHINLKFDEDFSGDESVYACIDGAGRPAAVDGEPCNGLVADDIPAVPDNDGRTFMGVESLALKYNKDDPGYVREALSHAILEDRGVPAGRAAHVALELVITPSARSATLFGRALPQTYAMGVYTALEPVDKPFVQRRYGTNGYVFKVGGGDLTRGDDPACLPYEAKGAVYVSAGFCRAGVEQPDPVDRIEWLGAERAALPAVANATVNQGAGPTSQFAPYQATYDLKTKKSSIAAARVALEELIALVSDPATTPAQLAAVFEVDDFIRAQAVDIAVGAVDHYARVANNYYLYLNPDTGRWTYIPYDYDFAFRDAHIAAWPLTPPFRDVVASTVFTGATRWRDNRVAGVDPRLYDLVFSDEGNRAKLLEELSTLRHGWLDWSGHTRPVLERWLSRLEPAIRATTGGDPGSGDTAYARQAVLGDRYSYASYVNATNPLSSSAGGSFPPDAWADAIPSDDTIKRYVERRSAALGAEAP